jgi:hypothetical protein
LEARRIVLLSIARKRNVVLQLELDFFVEFSSFRQWRFHGCEVDDELVLDGEYCVVVEILRVLVEDLSNECLVVFSFDEELY